MRTSETAPLIHLSAEQHTSHKWLDNSNRHTTAHHVLIDEVQLKTWLVGDVLILLLLPSVPVVILIDQHLPLGRGLLDEGRPCTQQHHERAISAKIFHWEGVSDEE